VFIAVTHLQPRKRFSTRLSALQQWTL